MAYEPWKATFGVGTRVKVISQTKYSSEKLTGLEGTVKSDSGKSIAVLLYDIRNERSSYGYFYFKPDELVAVGEFVNENMEEKNMRTVTAITNYLNVAEVKYVNAPTRGVFQYANFESDLTVGDLCVVKSEENTLLVAEVEKILEPVDHELYREVVAKVHTGAYDTRVACRAKAAELKAKMEARAKQLQDVALYKMLAENDPDMAALLNEYQAIPKL